MLPDPNTVQAIDAQHCPSYLRPVLTFARLRHLLQERDNETAKDSLNRKTLKKRRVVNINRLKRIIVVCSRIVAHGRLSVVIVLRALNRGGCITAVSVILRCAQTPRRWSVTGCTVACVTSL